MNFLKQLKYWFSTESSGLHKRIDDIRDILFHELFGVEKWEPKSTKVELFPVFEKDQHFLQDCSFNAWARALSVFFGEDVSVRWLAAKAWQQGYCSKGGAATLEKGGKVAQKFGVVFEKDLPSDQILSWEEFVKIDFIKFDPIAAENKIPSFARVTNLNDYFRAIDKGYAVVLGRTWMTSMNQGGGFKSPWVIARLGLPVGGHATAGMGYNLDYQSKKVDIEKNSYSDQWGDKGKFYCPIEDLEKYDFSTYGAYVITEIPYTPKEVKITLIKQALDLISQILSKKKV